MLSFIFESTSKSLPFRHKIPKRIECFPGKKLNEQSYSIIGDHSKKVSSSKTELETFLYGSYLVNI